MQRLALGVAVAALVAAAWALGQVTGTDRPPGMVANPGLALTPLGLFAALVGLVWGLAQAAERYGAGADPVLAGGGRRARRAGW